MCKTERRFAVQFALGMTLLASASLIFDHVMTAAVAATLGLAHLILGAVAPGWLSPWRRALEGSIRTLALIVSGLILTLFYLLVMTPFSWLWKATGKDALAEEKRGWITVSERENNPESLRKLY